ncbi:hypothetical protein [Granulicella sp. S190]|uniref:hypothetical protein n=1 Tax=Granulicella sp. S190 TaxID=1747226 RepID=UPI00131E3DC9|nr:hypothetical protein [Granulicella sp. S190]
MSDDLKNTQPEERAADLEHELDQRLLRALEAAPEVDIPADFAARVARNLPARRPEFVTATHYGEHAVFLGMLLTLAVLIVLTLHNGRHAGFGLAESLLLTQFLALTIWISVRRHGVS